MRYFKLIIIFFFLILTKAYAQQEPHFFDPNSKLTWLGADFTKAKFIGGRDEYEIVKIPMLLKAWNDLMFVESDKYNIPRMLHRKTVDYRLDIAIKHDTTLNLRHVLTEDMKFTTRLTQDSIADIVAHYDFEGLTGYGLMLNVESFNRVEEMGYVWVTFVDMGTKRVLFTRRLNGEPGGCWLRNYWAGSIYRVMGKVEKTSYSQWSKRQ